MFRHDDPGHPAALPRKTREIHNHHMDSTRWNGFPFRDGDIVIATWARSGTTWTQQIVSQLIFNGAEGINLSSLSPWIENRVSSGEAQRISSKHKVTTPANWRPGDDIVVLPFVTDAAAQRMFADKGGTRKVRSYRHFVRDSS